MVKLLERVKLSMTGYAEKLKARRQDDSGREVPDPVPVAPPIGYKKSPSMVEIVRDMVRSERLRMEVEAAGLETFEEADDFDVDEEVQLHSPYENDFDPPLKEMVAAGQAEVAKKKKPAPPADGPGAEADAPGGPPAPRKGQPPKAAPDVDEA